ncbi:MAG TPA: hypothetical protein VFZ68_16820 [Acidimicrobiales bacterium]
MVDPDQPAEDFDDDKLAGEFPPERPMGVDEQGVTGVEQLGGESVAERDDRTEPEVWERSRPAAGRSREAEPGVELAGDEEVGAVDEEKTMVARAAEDEVAREAGSLATDDQFTGDETTRDVATERVSAPAEEVAVQEDDAAPGATP